MCSIEYGNKSALIFPGAAVALCSVWWNPVTSAGVLEQDMKYTTQQENTVKGVTLNLNPKLGRQWILWIPERQ